LLIDLKLDGKYIIVVGGGAEGYRKTLSFVDSGAKILVVSRAFSSGIKKLQRINKVSLLETAVLDAEAFVKSLTPKPDLLVAVTNDHTLNTKLVKHAKSAGCMVYAVDNPSISDFILPALAKLGEVRIAISTSGKSPVMARALRQRIEKMVTQEDLFEIKLQTYARAILKKRIPDQKVRRKVLYRVLKDDEVTRSLKQGKIDEAKVIAMKIMENFWIKETSKKNHSATVKQNLQEA
jgi:precorrin-2 dehydrogenase/sirohydrochlorin ferrochelatase